MMMRGQTSERPRRFPNLFVPGAAKSGTTTLHEYLSLHQAIYMAAGKEPHCLCRSGRSLLDYDRIFGDRRPAVYYGESSTMYMILPDVIPSIRAHVTSPRFIFVLRNPVDRAWSHYWWARGRAGREDLAFEDAFRNDLVREPRKPCGFNNHYFQSGRYSHWLTFYRSAFGRDSMLLLPFEDLISQPAMTLDSVWQFLKLPTITFNRPQRENQTAVIRFPSLFRTYAALGRSGRRALDGWLPPRAMEDLTKLYRRSRGKLLSATAIGKPPSMDGQVRQWVAQHYSSDVGALRDVYPTFRDHWTADFPV
jgi:sulfotransferase family protein